MPTDARRAPVLWALLYTGLLYASFAHNVFWIPDSVTTVRDGFRVGYLGHDSDLVLNRLAMARNGAGVIDPLYGSAPWPGSDGRHLYRSQFGLQGVGLSLVFRETGGSVEGFAGWAACGFALLTAAVFAVFFAAVVRWVGPTAAIAGVVLTAFTPAFLPFASSLYWTCFLLLAPSVAVWVLYPRCAGSRSRYAGLLLLTAGLVGLKCLCGYEYITTVLLAPAAGVVYHTVSAGGRVRGAVRPAVALVLAGLLGFGAALTIHAAQLTEVTGRNGWDVIADRANANTVGQVVGRINDVTMACLAPDLPFLPERVRLPVRCVLSYFWQPAVATPATWGVASGFLPFGVVVVAVLAAGRAVWQRRGRLPTAVAALVPACGVGFLAGASWHLLAPTHTCVHQQFNLVTYAVAFLPPAYALLGWVFERATARRPWVRLGLGVGLVAVVSVNVWVAGARRDAERAADGRAAAPVVARMAGADVPGFATSHFIYTPLAFGSPPEYLDSEVWAPGGRLIRCIGGTGTPTWVHKGAVAFRPDGVSHPAVRVVAAAGGRVLPARVGYSRGALVERKLGDGMACVVFVVAVAEAEIPPGEPVRLFAVLGTDPPAVAELTNWAGW
jgi:hypothetical protein